MTLRACSRSVNVDMIVAWRGVAWKGLQGVYLRRISEELPLGNGREKLLTSASVKAVGALLDIGDL